MTFDPVHDIQSAFRSLLEAYSFPGRTVDITVPAQRLGTWVRDPGANLALALGAAVLVDQETSYSVAQEGPVARFLADWTSSCPRAPGDSAYLVLPEFDDQSLAELLDQAPVGTLADPHLGATVLVGTGDLDLGVPYRLSGPGIDGATVRPLPAGDRWIISREKTNTEFPLGVDLVFFDLKGQATALPRTTRVAAGGED